MNQIMTGVVFAAGLMLSTATTAFAETAAPDAVAFDEGAVTQSLTGVAGDPAKGREWFAGRKLGNCLACHANSDLDEQSFHGEVGPELDGVADRWTEAELRGIIVNAKMMFEGTIMPSFYRLENGARTHENFAGKTILSAEQVEDVVAYLMTLKE